VKADERISDVVTGPQMVDKMSCCVEYRLELVDQVGRQAGQYNITTIKYCVYYHDLQHLQRGSQHRTANLEEVGEESRNTSIQYV